MSKVAILTHSTVSLALPLTRVHFRTKEEKNFSRPDQLLNFYYRALRCNFWQKFPPGRWKRRQTTDERSTLAFFTIARKIASAAAFLLDKERERELGEGRGPFALSSITPFLNNCSNSL